MALSGTSDQYRTCAGWRTGLVLVVVCAAVYLPGLFLKPAVDRDESRFAQASRQMLEGDSLTDWVVPMVQDRPRLNKPPLIYWLQAGSAAVATGGEARHDAIWMYRIPSLLAAIGTVLVTWRLGLMLYPAGGVAALAAAMLAVSPLMAWEAAQARADQVLLFATACAMWALLAIWQSRGGLAAVLGLWIAIGAGVLVKGPITPMVVLLAVAALSAWSGNWRWFGRARPILGLAIVLAMVLPWVLLVARAVGLENYLSIIYDETLGRSKAPKEGHWGPPGYHLAMIIVVFWPGAILTAVGVLHAFGRVFRRARMAGPRLLAPVRSWWGTPTERFLLAWLVPSWIIFELVQTKLPHYTMPLLPALALLSARAVLIASSRFAPLGGLARFGALVWAGFGLVFAGLTAAMALGAFGPLACVVTAACMLALWWPLARAAWQSQCLDATRWALALAAALAIATGALLPRVDAIWNTPPLAATQAVADAVAKRTPIGAVGYHEDSLIFATRGLAKRIDPEDLDAWLAEHDRAVLILPIEQAEADPRLEITDRRRGFNYSNGSRVDLAVARERE